MTGCDQAQTVSVTVEDFRFTPEVLRVNAISPLSLSIYNAGRETHEFDSPVLLYATKTAATHSRNSANSGIVLEPGRSIQIIMAPPPGIYLYICRRKGHADMTGTLIVE